MLYNEFNMSPIDELVQQAQQKIETLEEENAELRVPVKRTFYHLTVTYAGKNDYGAVWAHEPFAAASQGHKYIFDQLRGYLKESNANIIEKHASFSDAVIYNVLITIATGNSTRFRMLKIPMSKAVRY